MLCPHKSRTSCTQPPVANARLRGERRLVFSAGRSVRIFSILMMAASIIMVPQEKSGEIDKLPEGVQQVAGAFGGQQPQHTASGCSRSWIKYTGIRLIESEVALDDPFDTDCSRLQIHRVRDVCLDLWPLSKLDTAPSPYLCPSTPSSALLIP